MTEAAPAQEVDRELRRYWYKYDQRLYTILQTMERSETWPISDNESLWMRENLGAIESALQSKDGNIQSEEQQQALLRVAGFLRSTRAVRLFLYLEKTDPGYTQRLLEQARGRTATPKQGDPAEDDGDVSTSLREEVSRMAAQVHIDRFAYLRRVGILNRVFSTERLALVERIIMETD